MHRGSYLCYVSFFSLIFQCYGKLLCNSTLPKSPGEMELFQYLTDPCRYDKNQRPSTPSEVPVDISLRTFIYYLKAHNIVNQMDMMLLFEFKWTDSRLQYSNFTERLNNIMRGRLIFRNRIWIPHTHVTNDKATKVTGLVRKDSYVNIRPSGLVVFTVRMKTSVKCQSIHSEWFPFDQQICDLFIHNWRYDLRNVRSQWDTYRPVIHKNQLSPINFYLTSIETHSGLEAYINPNEDCQVSCKYNHSSLKMSFKFNRQAGFYLLDFYFPSVIIVMISWVSFWMAPDASPGRCSAGTGSIIAFLLLSWSGSPIPKTSTFKVNDVWEISCFIFILASMYEFALVNMIDRRKSKNVKLKRKSVKYIMRYSMTTKSESRLNIAARRLSVSCPTSPEFKRKFIPMNELSTMKKLKELREKDFNAPSKRSGSLRVKNRVPDFMTPMISGRSPHPEIIIEESEDGNKSSSEEEVHTFFTMTPQEIAKWIDTKSRFVFPLAFLAFNLFYWSFLWVPKSFMND